MATTTPRAWLGCLAAYNEGHLHGEWVDATDADELHEAAERVIKTSPADFPEELFIADYDGFGEVSRTLGEYASLETVAHIGELIEEHGEAFIAWVGTLDYGADLGEISGDDFRGHFRGEWDSEEAFAMEEVCELGWSNVPAQVWTSQFAYNAATAKPLNVFDELAGCLNWESIARDMFQHGNYTFVNGYVFEDEA